MSRPFVDTEERDRLRGKIRDLLRRCGWTYEDAAVRSGMTYAFISGALAPSARAGTVESLGHLLRSLERARNGQKAG